MLAIALVSVSCTKSSASGWLRVSERANARSEGSRETISWCSGDSLWPMGLPPLRGPGGNCRYVSARRTETGSAGTMFRATRTFWRRGTCGPGVPGPGTEGRSAFACGLPEAVEGEEFPLQNLLNTRETMVAQALGKGQVREKGCEPG